MTPHRFNDRGTYVIDRQFDSIGRIQRASGTNDPAILREIDAMLTVLWGKGRHDILEQIRDGHVKPIVALRYFREERLDMIPTGQALRPVKPAWEAWVKAQDIPASSKKDLGYTLIALIGRGKEERTDLRISEIPERFTEVRIEKEGRSRAIQKIKAHIQAFLRDTVGDDHLIYRAIRRVKVGKVRISREAPQWSPDEVRAFIAKIPDCGPDIWTLCITGMLPNKEYHAVWRVERDRIAIDGQKRKGRKRIIPVFGPVSRPSMHPRTLADKVREASGGAIQVKDFRNFFSRWMRDAGIKSLNRKLYMGHGPTSMTEHYEWGEMKEQLEGDRVLFVAYVGGGAHLRLLKSEGA